MPSTLLCIVCVGGRANREGPRGTRYAQGKRQGKRERERGSMQCSVSCNMRAVTLSLAYEC